jgi:hypothetical protein
MNFPEFRSGGTEYLEVDFRKSGWDRVDELLTTAGLVGCGGSTD